MKFDLPSIFHTKPKIKGVISQYHLLEWWQNSFTDEERLLLIAASKKVKSFGIITESLKEDENILTNSDWIHGSIGPVGELTALLPHLDLNNQLYYKYADAIEGLTHRYLGDNFDIDKESKLVFKELDWQLFVEKYKVGLKSQLDDIEGFYSYLITTLYKLSAESIHLDRLLKYCETYLNLSNKIFKASVNCKNYCESVENTPNSHVRLIERNSTLERCIMVLQNQGKYQRALNEIQKIKDTGWKIDWTKRELTLRKKIIKSENSN